MRLRCCSGLSLGAALGAHPLQHTRTTRTHTSPHPRADAGLPVVRGVNYAGVRFLKEAGTISEVEALALEEGAVSEPKMPTFASRATLG